MWKDGKQHGKGVLKSPDGTYSKGGVKMLNFIILFIKRHQSKIEILF
jgi:hypothetical protein